MWDWSTSKTPAPVGNVRDDRAQQAQSQGVTPVRRDVRPVPVYRDPRPSWTPQQPAPQQPYVPQPMPQQYAPQGYAPQPMPQGYAPQPMPPQYAPQGYAPQPMPQGYAPQPMPQQYAPQGYAPQPMPQGYAPQPMPQQYAPQPVPQAPYAPHPAPQIVPQGYAPQPVIQQAEQPVPAARPAVPTVDSAYNVTKIPRPVESTGDRSDWEYQLTQLDLPNMELQEVNFVMLNAQWKLELRKAFKRARRDFLKYVGYHNVNELIAIGLTDDDIRKIKKGKASENVNVHIKIPFDYGGTNDFSNLILMQTHPFHADLHKFIDMQISRQQQGGLPKRLFVPVPAGKVYVPGDIVVSSGGKGKHDRSVYAGFLESTFEAIAQRSAMDR